MPILSINDAKKSRLEKLIERKYPDQLQAGIKVEMEHTDNPAVARKIACDHLSEDPEYYTKLAEAGLVDEPEARAMLPVRLEKAKPGPGLVAIKKRTKDGRTITYWTRPELSHERKMAKEPEQVQSEHSEPKPDESKIFRNALGVPEPQAIISVFGAKYGQPGSGYLSLRAESDVHDKRWPYESRDVSHIVKEMESDEWECTVSKDGYNAPVIHCVHKPTKKKLEELQRKRDEKWSEAKDVFIRYGNLPPGGYSTDWSSGKKEKGVSVFRGKILPTGEVKPILSTDQQQGTFFMGGITNRPVFVLEGEVVGTGADGEPVMKNPKKHKPEDYAKKIFQKSVSLVLHKSEPQKVVALDFDGVLNSYSSGWQGHDKTDDPVPGAAGAIRELWENGFKVVIYSARANEPKGVQAIRDFLAEKLDIDPKGIDITDKKPIADVYVDDRAINFAGDWKKTLAAIKGFKSWIGKSLTWSGHKLQGHTKIHGMDISIENRKGSVRRGVDKDGHEWATKMHFAYGYIRGTVGKDKDHLDCYVGPNPESQRVFIIHQNDPVTGKYDEDKVMLGWNTPEEAKAAYLKQYDRPGFFGSMDEADIDSFKAACFDKANHGKKLMVKSEGGEQPKRRFYIKKTEAPIGDHSIKGKPGYHLEGPAGQRRWHKDAGLNNLIGSAHQNIGDFEEGKFPRYQSISLGQTNPYLAEHGGLKKLPLKMRQAHLRKILEKHSHEVDREMIARIPEYLEHPVAIYKGDPDRNPGTIIVLTDQYSLEGKPLMVAILPSEEDGENYVQSIYGRWKRYFTDMDKSRVIFRDSEKYPAWQFAERTMDRGLPEQGTQKSIASPVLVVNKAISW
jgi:hypothetical protein